MKDANLIKTVALPDSAGDANSPSIDLEHTAHGDHLVDMELEASAPVLTATELPDDETATYKVEHSDDDSSFATVPGCAAVITQTGASGAGAAAATEKVRLPRDVKRYVRVTATTSAGAGDCSGKSLSAALVL